MSSRGNPKPICFLCRRKFPTTEALRKHEQLSELHKKNLVEQREKMMARRQFLRQTLRIKRQKLAECDAFAQDPAGSVTEVMQKKQQYHDLGNEMQELETELGDIQEKIEAEQEKPQASQSRYERFEEGVVPPHYLPSSGTCMVKLAPYAVTWQGNKDFQEDRYILGADVDAEGFSGGIIFAVLDGHNGPKCADYVQENLPRNLSQCLRGKPKPLTDESVSRAIVEAFILTDADFLKVAFGHQMLDGSTAVAAVFWTDEREQKHKVAIAHCGDSRAVVSRTNSCEMLSIDHKPDRKDESERVTKSGGMVSQVNGVWRVFTPAPVAFAGRVSQWGLAVSRSFGDLPLKDPNPLLTCVPEVKITTLSEDDKYLVLACDGIFDVLSNEEVHMAVSRQPQMAADKAAFAVTKLSYARGSEDNLTTLAIQISFDEPPSGRDVDAKRQRVSQA